jgi:phosphoglycolate phosphatase
MRFSTIVFDLDGTLIDSAPDLHQAIGRLLAEHGRPELPLAQVKRFIGDGAAKLVQRSLDAAGLADGGEALATALARFLAIYEADPSRFTRPYPGVPETLAALAAEGRRLAICTNKPAAATRLVLRDLGLAPLFAGVSGGDSLDVRKPDPAHVLDALARAGGDPASAVMVGDNEHDMAAGRGAGLPVVAVTWGYARVPIAELGADRVIERFEDLPTALASLG